VFFGTIEHHLWRLVRSIEKVTVEELKAGNFIMNGDTHIHIFPYV